MLVLRMGNRLRQFRHRVNARRAALGLAAMIVASAWSCTQAPEAPVRDRPLLAIMTTTDLPDARQPVTWVVSRPSQVMLRGTTNISDWTSDSAQVSGRIPLSTSLSELGDAFGRKATRSTTRRSRPSISLRRGRPAVISIPVLSLRGQSAGMENDLHNALKARQFPTIQYAFDRIGAIERQIDPATQQPVLILHVEGTLNMAGRQNPLPIDLSVRQIAAGVYTAHADASIRMSDYGVVPPTALFGLVRAREAVLVEFDLRLRAGAVAAPEAQQQADR